MLFDFLSLDGLLFGFCYCWLVYCCVCVAYLVCVMMVFCVCGIAWVSASGFGMGLLINSVVYAL